MSDMIEVVIDSIRVSLMSQQRIVILRERNADRYAAYLDRRLRKPIDHHSFTRS